jgi:hypothetical protein
VHLYFFFAFSSTSSEPKMLSTQSSFMKGKLRDNAYHNKLFFPVAHTWGDWVHL